MPWGSRVNGNDVKIHDSNEKWFLKRDNEEKMSENITKCGHRTRGRKFDR